MPDITKLLDGLSEAEARKVLAAIPKFLQEMRAQVEGKAPPDELAVTATKTHTGLGDLSTEFRRRGYTASEWQPGEVRVLPRGMAEGLLEGGGFRLPREGDRRLPNQGHGRREAPTYDSPDKLAELYATQEKVKAICVVGGTLEGNGWRDGGFTAHFNACGYPGEWWKNEIRELPVGLVRKLSDVCSTDPELIRAHEGVQNVFVGRRMAWAREYQERREQAQRRHAESEIAHRVQELEVEEQRAADRKRREQVMAGMAEEATK